MADQARVHVVIEGRVQGVFFRASTRDEARARGLGGWVRNLPDGRVEALFEGDQRVVENMLAWCHKGPPYAYVRPGGGGVAALCRGPDGFSDCVLRGQAREAEQEIRFFRTEFRQSQKRQYGRSPISRLDSQPPSTIMVI